MIDNYKTRLILENSDADCSRRGFSSLLLLPYLNIQSMPVIPLTSIGCVFCAYRSCVAGRILRARAHWSYSMTAWKSARTLCSRVHDGDQNLYAAADFPPRHYLGGRLRHLRGSLVIPSQYHPQKKEKIGHRTSRGRQNRASSFPSEQKSLEHAKEAK
jgi:hypothetical protein